MKNALDQLDISGLESEGATSYGVLKALALEKELEGRPMQRLGRDLGFANDYGPGFENRQGLESAMQGAGSELPQGYDPFNVELLKLRRLGEKDREDRRHNSQTEGAAWLRAKNTGNKNTGYQVHVDEEGKKWTFHPGNPKDTMQPLMQSGKQAKETKSIESSRIDDLIGHGDLLLNSIESLGLMRGETVGSRKGDSDATGWMAGLIWDPIFQRIWPESTDTLASMGNIGSEVTRERSGGAVPKAEMEKLVPFVPQAIDSPEEARKKMRQFVNLYADKIQNAVDSLEDSGRRVPAALRKKLEDRIRAARKVAGGESSAEDALGGKASAKEMLNKLLEEKARRAGQ